MLSHLELDQIEYDNHSKGGELLVLSELKALFPGVDEVFALEDWRQPFRSVRYAMGDKWLRCFVIDVDSLRADGWIVSDSFYFMKKPDGDWEWVNWRHPLLELEQDFS